MHVVLLQPSDATQYRELMLQAYELAADAFTTTAEERAAEPESFWIKRISNASGLSAAFGAFEGKNLIGTVALEFSAKPKTRHKALVIGMYTAPTARKNGVGRALLKAAVAFAQAKDGLQSLTLTVTEGNEPAVSLYRSVGFQVFGVEPMAINTTTGFKGSI
ncbi:MAG: GNAT family N-acetyltransferase, partial [Coriobacteriia bacterium]|nr:GNAT family N-acetyltransferase [Coriobacteriia bacterium]